jgi:hypothetical protein
LLAGSRLDMACSLLFSGRPHHALTVPSQMQVCFGQLSCHLDNKHYPIDANCAHASATSSESCLNTGASLKTLSLVAGDSRAKSGSGGVHSSLVCGGLEWHCSGPQEAWLCPSWYATCHHPCILTKKFCKFSFQGPFLLSCLVCSTPLGYCCMHCERPIICANSVALSLNDIGCNMVAACYGKETNPAD